MRHVFDIHNEIGRFCDERIYQTELAERCQNDRMEVQREVQIRISHGNFVKPLYLDLMVQGGVIYELKAIDALSGHHEKQLITYLHLTNLFHGKLLNFRPPSVMSRFISTTLTHAERLSFEMIADEWCKVDNASCQLYDSLHSLLADWGAFYDVSLYREALLQLLAAPGAGIMPVQVVLAGRIVGSQNMCLLNQNTAWHLSAIRSQIRAYEGHLRRLMNHTNLHYMQWINMDHKTITLKNIKS